MCGRATLWPVSSHDDPAPEYAERLYPPVSYALIALIVGLSFVTAVGWYLGPWFAAGATIVTLVGIGTFLIAIGRTRIAVDERGFSVGPSLLEWSSMGPPITLDAVAARARLGVGADARAFVVERPYIAEAVEISVLDAADPHPYWFVATRRPARLAAALASGLSRYGHGAS